MISSLELARLAGVSQGTVDRALHGRTGVAEATRTRVLALAEAHGYRPNPAARELMGLTASNLVGAVVHAGGTQVVFFNALLTAIHRRLRADGLHLVMSYADGADEQAGLATELLGRRLRALIVVYGDPGLALPTAGVPVLALVTPIAGLTALLPDEVATGRLAAGRLLALGHRHLGMIADARHAVGRARRDGFVAACQAAGATVGVHSDPAAAPAAVRAGATALFCHSDPVAHRVLAVLREQGLSAPGDVAVAGVDGTDADPWLATMVYPFVGVADAVAAVIAGQTPPTIPDCVWRPGASAGRAPG